MGTPRAHNTRSRTGSTPLPRPDSPPPRQPAKKRQAAPAPASPTPAPLPPPQGAPAAPAPAPLVAVGLPPAGLLPPVPQLPPPLPLSDPRPLIREAASRFASGHIDGPSALAAIGIALAEADENADGATFASWQQRADSACSTIERALSRDAAALPLNAPQSAGLNLEHGSQGGHISRAWRVARRHTTAALHCSHEAHTTIVRLDTAQGTQIADVPATKPITDIAVLNYTIAVFTYSTCPGAASEEGRFTPRDAEALVFFVAEAHYTASRTDAIECALRRLFYAFDTDPTLPLADLIGARADSLLQSESRRLNANGSNARSGGQSSAQQRRQQASPPASKSSSGARTPQSATSSDFCYNFSQGRPCSDRTKVDGVCRYETAGKHICGFDLGSGSVCQGRHARADHH